MSSDARSWFNDKIEWKLNEFMYTECINIIMKGEILSRIQSYQTIRGKSSSNLHNK